MSSRKYTTALHMIVKDEAANLGDCLESVRGIFDEISIVDTGSTDATVKIARKFGAKVIHFPWCDDFSAARNHGLDRIRSDYVFRLDADDRLAPGHGKRLKRLLATLGDRPPLAYFCRVESTEQDGAKAWSDEHRLWPHHPAHRFRGRIHERLDFAIPAVTTDVKLVHHGYSSHELWTQKLERNLRILEAEPADADHPLRDFDLGRTLAGLARPREAAEALERFVAREHPNHRPAERQAFRRLVDVYCDLGDWKTALDAAQRGLKRSPRDARLWSQVGGLMFHASSIELAREAFAKAVAYFDPAKPDFGLRADFGDYLKAALALADRTPLPRPTEAVTAAPAAPGVLTIGDVLGFAPQPMP